MLIKYYVFPKNFVIFLNSASSAAALVFYLPGVCTHTATKGKQSPEYFSKFGKKHKTYNEHPVQVWKMWSRVHCGIFRLLDSKKKYQASYGISSLHAGCPFWWLLGVFFLKNVSSMHWVPLHEPCLQGS